MSAEHINTKVFNEKDIMAALSLLVRLPTSVDDQYFKTDLSIIALYKTINCNVVINGGRIGHVAYMGNDVYGVVFKSDKRIGIRNINNKMYSPVLSTLDFVKIEKSMEITLDVIEDRMINYHDNFRNMQLYSYSKDEKIRIIRLAIVNYNNISNNLKDFVVYL